MLKDLSEADQNLGRQRQRLPRILEERPELRDNDHQQQDHRTARHGQEDGGVYQRGLHVLGQGLRFLDEISQSFQNRIQRAARLSGPDHADVEPGKGAFLRRHGIGQRGATADPVENPHKHFAYRLFLRYGPEDLE